MQELVHFTADWCQPCKILAPIIENYLKEHPDVVYTKVDIDKDAATTSEYGVQGVPTLIVKTDNEITKRHTGVVNPNGLAKLFDN